jgi:hypothetical protein
MFKILEWDIVTQVGSLCHQITHLNIIVLLLYMCYPLKNFTPMHLEKKISCILSMLARMQERIVSILVEGI